MRTHLSIFSTERNTKYIPHEEITVSLITTDNLIHSAKPTVFLALLGNKKSCGNYILSPSSKTYANLMVFSLSLTCHHLPNSPQGLVQLVGISL